MPRESKPYGTHTVKAQSVSVIIPTKNAEPWIAACLESVTTQKFPGPHEIICLDSGSRDGTAQVLRRYPVKAIDAPETDSGHGKVRNLGIEKSRGTFIVLLSQDAVLADPLWLETMLENFDHDPLVAGAYCRQLPRPEASLLTRRAVSDSLAGRNAPSVSHLENPEEFRKMKPWDRYVLCNFDNVASIIRRDIWEKIPFDETYFGEDLGWSKKVIEAGYKVSYETRAAVFHSHERPLAYQLRRHYLHQRRIYELFEAAFLRHWWEIPLKTSSLWLKDLLFVLENYPGLIRSARLLLESLGVSFATCRGWYLGYRDAKDNRTLRYQL